MGRWRPGNAVHGCGIVARRSHFVPVWALTGHMSRVVTWRLPATTPLARIATPLWCARWERGLWKELHYIYDSMHTRCLAKMQLNVPFKTSSCCFYGSECVLETVTFLHDVCHPNFLAGCCTLLDTVIVSVFLLKKMIPVFNNYTMAIVLMICIKFGEFK